MGKCDKPCIKTASLSAPAPFGKRIMISVEGNTKYPTSHTHHEQCDDCLQEEIKEMKKQWSEAGGGGTDDDLFSQFDRMKENW
jgi:hypothetical protein